MTLDRNSINLNIGSTYELSATVGPSNAIDKNVVWSSSDTSVATVDNTGLVTVVGPGTAVITVKTVVGGLTASCVVNGPDQEQDGNGQIVALNEEPEAQPESQAPELYEIALAETDMAGAEPKNADEVQEEQPEPNQQTPAETDRDTDNTENTGEIQEQLAEPEEPDEEALVENGRYLAEKKDLAADSTTPRKSLQRHRTASLCRYSRFRSMPHPRSCSWSKTILTYIQQGYLLSCFFSGQAESTWNTRGRLKCDIGYAGAAQRYDAYYFVRFTGACHCSIAIVIGGIGN